MRGASNSPQIKAEEFGDMGQRELNYSMHVGEEFAKRREVWHMKR